MSHQPRSSNRWRIRGALLACAVAVAVAGGSHHAAAAGGPSLGAARSFAVLGASTVDSTGQTVVTGDVGVSPGTAIVGFPPGTIASGAVHAGDVLAAQAHADAALAYDFLAGMPSIPANNRSNVDLGGLTLAPGVYKFDAEAMLTGALTLDAGGDSGALFVFQVGTALTTSSGASVTVINGGANYDESNVFWQLGSSATLGAGTAFTGQLLAYASVTMVTGATLNGSAMALTGAVTLDGNTVTSPPLAGPPVIVPGAPLAPINLTAVPIGVVPCSGSTLSWTDASTTESVFRVFRRDGAAPDVVLIGSVATANAAGTGGAVTYQDLLLDASTTYTYRVTASSLTAVESNPSNEVRVDACIVVGGGRLNVELGRCVITDKSKADSDGISLKGTYSVIGGVSSDPRPDGVTIQVRAPGNLVLVRIAPNDPRWKAQKRGVYTWKSEKGDAIASSIVIDTRKSEFTLKTKKGDFGAMPVNAITVSLTCQRATGSDTRAWDLPNKLPKGTRARFTLPK